MSKTDELERGYDGLRDRVRDHVSDATDAVDGMVTRGRRAVARFDRPDRRCRLKRLAGDVADEANYQYRRVRRHVRRRPVAAVAVVAGTIGAFMLLRHLFRSDED